MAKAKTRKKATPRGATSDYPRHSVRKALRIPKAILEQNAGKACADKDAAGFCNVGHHGPFKVELSSAIKYGLLSRPRAGTVEVTDLAKRIIRPQSQSDAVDGLREAVMNAPRVADVYKHYRGENIPDEPFFGNALTDTFGIPEDKRDDFRSVFLGSLRDAQLVEEHGDKLRILDVARAKNDDDTGSVKSPGKSPRVSESDTCFVMMPFSDPVGSRYASVYEPAIVKAGLKPVRADDDIFTTGKIIDQIWTGINGAKVLVAELTGRNPNVFYELGLAHALRKPVVLVSSTDKDVPFDVAHIRVIYYDVNDPFWGEKLKAKIAENIASALLNPQEAQLWRSADETK